MQSYKNVLDACVRSNIAYLSPHTMKQIWINVHDKKTSKKHGSIVSSLVDVDTEPIFLSIGAGAKAYTWRKKNTLFVTFRGTYGLNVSDIKANIDLRHHILEPYGVVHKGYWLYNNTIFHDLINQILSQQNNIDNIDFTGHSMGSTLATLSAFKTHLLFKNKYRQLQHVNINCHVFGGPKFCDKKFSDNFMNMIPNCSHTIIRGDCVPEIYNGFEPCIQNIKYLEDGGVENINNYDNILSIHACTSYIKLLSKKHIITLP